MTSKIEISHRTIVFTLALLGGIWLVLQVREILYLLFIAFLLMTALRPMVDKLEYIKIPRILAIILVYAIVFGVLGVGIGGSIPALASQTAKLIHELPAVVSRVLPEWNIDARAISQQIAPISENIVRVTVSIFSNVVTTVTVLVFSFYFLLEHKYLRTFVADTAGQAAASRLMYFLEQLERRLGAWVNGQILLMFTIGLSVYLGLEFVLKLDFALPLAILAGLLEIVPFVGPILSAVPAVLLALATSPFYAASVIALYFIVQQVENNVLVPIIMKKSVGLSPLITIVSLMVGSKLAGVVGAILAVPIFLMGQVLVETWLAERSSDAAETKPTVKH